MALVKIYKQGSGGGGATTLVVGSTKITGGAVGRVLFEGATNVLQESSKLFWDNTNGRLGIGENTPLGILHLKEVAQATRFLIDGDAGQNKIITYRTGGLQRFGLYCNNIAESGSNAGSDFAIRAYSDLGVLLSTPLYIKRSSGNVLINTTTDSGYKLDVNGTTILRGIVYGVGSGGTPIQLLTTVGTGTALIGGNAATPLRFQGQNIQLLVGSTAVGQFNATTGNFTLQNGGTFTDAGFRLDVVGTARISGAVTLTSSLTVTSASAMGSSLAVGTFSASVASAQMEIVSTTRGFLPPRMTTAEKNAIATPASGLIVYDTTLGKLCVRGASAWETITSV
jgi:hypothetical protein